MTWECLHGGLLTTVQDAGRRGWLKDGVVAGGALDEFAMRTANILVGNEENAAGLEVTLKGPVLRSVKDSLIAVCGADLSLNIDGHSVPLWRPVWVRENSVLRFGECREGCRAYLAVAGGIDVPKTLGSRSTYLRAGLGGIEGRALREGDVLPSGDFSPTARRRADLLRSKAGARNFSAAAWSISTEIMPPYGTQPQLRVLLADDFARLTSPSKESFWRDTFRLTNESDRMGCRLRGGALQTKEQSDLVSEATANGAIQLPPDGQMIVLLADRQTVGGYPKIAHVASVDLPVLAQVRPGDGVRFAEISLGAAQELLCRRERHIAELKVSIDLRD